MISTDNIADIFSFNPSLELYNTLTNIQKNEVLKRYALSSIMLYSWKQNMLKIRAVDIIDQAIVDEDNNIVVMEELRYSHYFERLVDYCLYNTTQFHSLISSFTELDFDKYTIVYHNIRVNNNVKELVKAELGHKVNHLTYDAAKCGNLELLKNLISNIKEDLLSFVNYEYVIQVAAEKGHLHIIKYLEKNNFADFESTILYYAVKGGQLEIVKYIADYSKFTAIANTAYEFGQMNIVKHYNDDLSFKQTECGTIVKINKRSNKLNDLALSAAKFGRIDMLRRAYNESKTNLARKGDIEYHKVAKNGYIDVINFISDESLDWNTIALEASEKGHSHIVRLALSRGAKDHHNLVKKIACHGDKKIIKELVGYDVSELHFGLHLDCYKYFGIYTDYSEMDNCEDI